MIDSAGECRESQNSQRKTPEIHGDLIAEGLKREPAKKKKLRSEKEIGDGSGGLGEVKCFQGSIVG